MQPMNGLKYPARWCAETARKKAWRVRRPAERDRAPEDPVERARGCRSCYPRPSVPATTPPPGQLSENADLAVRRNGDPRPGDRDAARDAVALVRRGAAAEPPGTRGDRERSDETRRGRSARALIRASGTSTPRAPTPTRIATSAAIVTPTVISRYCLV